MNMPTCAGIVLALGGCASVKHSPVAYHPYPAGSVDAPELVTAEQQARNNIRALNAQEDAKFTGVRYYRSSYYLLVYTDGKGGLVWQLQPMMDQTQLCVATPDEHLAKASSSVTLNNGVLSNSHADTDTTALLKATISALEKVIPFLALDVSKSGPTVPAPLLFKVVPDKKDPSRWTLIGEPSSAEVHVVLKKGEGS